MKLSQLRDVIAIADQGSLRGAARSLGVAQPALTRSIRAIEEELGAQLFERGPNGVTLTEAGNAFVRRARAVQAEIQRASDEVAQISGDQRGLVSIAMSAVSTFALLPSALSAFRARYPDAQIKITEGFFVSIEASLAAGMFDFYVGPYSGHASRRRFVAQRLLENRRVVVARKGHSLCAARSLADLSGADWVKQTLHESGSEADFEQVFEAHALPRPRVVMHTSSATATLMAVASAGLLTMVPRRMLSAPIHAGLFDVVPVRERLSAAPICIVQRADLPLAPLAQHFHSLIQLAAGRYQKGTTDIFAGATDNGRT